MLKTADGCAGLHLAVFCRTTVRRCVRFGEQPKVDRTLIQECPQARCA